MLEVFLEGSKKIVNGLDEMSPNYKLSVWRRACIIVSRYGASYQDGVTSVMIGDWFWSF